MRPPPQLLGMCLMLAACFSPRHLEGSACIDVCPGELSCVNGRCVGDGGDDGGDGGDGEGDAGIDGPTAVCPPGYVRNLAIGSSYRVVNTAATHPAAVADCADDGASTYLAIPDTQAESDALDRIANNDAWLGITDAAADRTWVTVLGAPQTIFRWGLNQPDGGEKESCAFVADAVWQDVPCTISKPYVCECR